MLIVVAHRRRARWRSRCFFLHGCGGTAIELPTRPHDDDTPEDRPSLPRLHDDAAGRPEPGRDRVRGARRRHRRRLPMMRPRRHRAGACWSLAAAWLRDRCVAGSAAVFAAHMTAHMLVVAVAAPLLALGCPARDSIRCVRASWLVAADPGVARRAGRRVGLACARAASRRAPSARRLRRRAGVLPARRPVVCGWPCSAAAASDRLARAGAGIVALLLTFAHMTLLGALLSLTPRPLYGHGDPLDRPMALADQQLGGTIMLVVGADRLHRRRPVAGRSRCIARTARGMRRRHETRCSS